MVVAQPVLGTVIPHDQPCFTVTSGTKREWLAQPGGRRAAPCPFPAEVSTLRSMSTGPQHGPKCNQARNQGLALKGYQRGREGKKENMASSRDWGHSWPGTELGETGPLALEREGRRSAPDNWAKAEC